MAYVSERGNGLQKPGLFARLGELGADLRKAYAMHNEYRRTLTELQSLSARELRDLGLNYSMMHQVAWEAAEVMAKERGW